MTRSAADLKIGEQSTIVQCTEQEFTCKLITLGALPEATITLIRKAPIGGALYLKINNHLIAVRKEEAQSILIKE